MQPHRTDNSWWARRCPGSEVGRTLHGEMALASVEGCPKWQQRKEEQHQGQSLAVGKDLCHGMMFGPTGLTWIWPCLCKVCVSPCSPGMMYPCYSQPCWCQWILQFVYTSPSIPATLTFPLLPADSVLLQCPGDNRTATCWITIPKIPGSAFFPKHIFTLQPTVQSQHEEANPFTQEKQRRSWPAHRCFPAI